MWAENPLNEMAEHNQEILKSLIFEFCLLQLFAGIFWYLIYRLFRKKITKARTVILINLLIYSFLNLYIIYQISNEKDLRVGGVTFAFEMYTYFWSLAYILILLMQYFIFSYLKRHKNNL